MMRYKWDSSKSRSPLPPHTALLTFTHTHIHTVNTQHVEQTHLLYLFFIDLKLQGTICQVLHQPMGSRK